MFPRNLVILALCVLPAFSAPSPLLTVQKAKEPISGRYVVMLKEGASCQTNIESLSRGTGNTTSVTHQWDFINGFAGSFSEDQVETLKSNPDVLSIEEDGVVHTQTTITQTDAPWGLGRISSQNKLSNQNSTALTFSYNYDSTAGSGATVYIIDTGVFINHPAFGGRASWGTTFGDYPDEDGNGHGTHCAGTAVSGPYGVAKNAHVVAVKVLSDNGTGSIADIISGVNWVASNHESGPVVASLSLGGDTSTALDNAIVNLINSGVTTVVAAGNNNTDANTFSPARVTAAITVGAITIADAKASYSNYGSVVDIWAPGTNITSTWNDGGKHVISGTSMATPHVSGFAAYLLGLDSSLTPSSVLSTIKSNALSGVLGGIPSGTVNLLLNNGL